MDYATMAAMANQQAQQTQMQAQLQQAQQAQQQSQQQAQEWGQFGQQQQQSKWDAQPTQPAWQQEQQQQQAGKMGGKGKGGPGCWVAEQEMYEMMSYMMYLKGKKGMKGGKDGGKDFGKGKGFKGDFKGKGKGKHERAKRPNGGPVQAIPWKLRLSNAYEKLHRKNPTKETIVYSVEGEDGSFTCTLSSEDFMNVHTTEEAFPSRREAEDSAALMALESEFPDYFAEIPATQLPFKIRLVRAYEEQNAEKADTATFVYTVTQEGEAGMVCSVACEKFSAVYEGQEFTDSKSQAEEHVAKLALQHEYPAQYEAASCLPPPSKKSKTSGSVKAARKQAALESGEPLPEVERSTDPKSRVSEGMMVLLGRSLQAGDVSYQLQQDQEGVWATVTINCDSIQQTFSGEKVPSPTDKKNAERQAAAVAMETLEPLIEEKRPEHEANKVLKAAAQAEKRKAVQEAKLAEKGMGKGEES